jgi:diphthamide synthase (EF-2-diphthine--ammonia ligase)
MIPSGILDAQSDAIGIPLVKQQATPKTYENDFKSALLETLKAKGAEGISHGRHLRSSRARRRLAGTRTKRSRLNTRETAYGWVTQNKFILII